MDARPRLVSAAGFAAAAALFGVGATGGLLLLPHSSVPGEALVIVPAALASLAAVVGAATGPWLVRAVDGLAAAVIGIVGTGATAGVATLLAVAGVAVHDVTIGIAPGAALRESGNVLWALFGYAVVVALAASPFGALGAFLAWRRIRRDDGRAEVRP